MDDGEIRPQTHTCVPFIIHRSNQSMKLPLLVKHSRITSVYISRHADPSLLQSSLLAVENQKKNKRERERESEIERAKRE